MCILPILQANLKMGTLNSLPLCYLETVADILQVEASVLFLAHAQTLNSYSDNLVLVFIVVYCGHHIIF